MSMPNTLIITEILLVNENELFYLVLGDTVEGLIIQDLIGLDRNKLG
jgi:hypothetical protein